MLDFIANFLLGVSFAAALGPVTIEMMKRGLKNGFLPAFLVGLGAASADSAFLTLGYFGLTSFISFPYVKKSIWILGALVLAFMAYSSLKELSQKTRLKTTGTDTRNSFFTGFIIAATSPITIAWWLTFAGAILSSANATASLSTLASAFTIILGIISWFFAFSLLLNYGKKLATEKTMKLLSALSALAFLAFSIYFAYNAFVL